MTQPPGPYGPPYGHPAPYGRPGPVRRPPEKKLLPWLIVGGAVLLSGIGILLVVLFAGGGSATVDESPSSGSSTAPATSSSSASPSRPSALGDLPGGAQVAEPTVTAGGTFEGSDGGALA
jgi:hypothetical protein